MKPVAKVVLAITGTLIALHAPGRAQGHGPYPYMESLRKAEAEVPAFASGATGEKPTEQRRAMLQRISSPLQALAVARAFVGDTEGAQVAFDVPNLQPGVRGQGKADDLKAIEDAPVEDAIEAIVAAARTKRVVLINEAHHVPMHRAFAHKLAIELRKIGYTYLAAETFQERDEGRTMKGYVNAGFGYYTQDPVYADFVNQTMADGWNIVSYEASPESMTGTPAEQMEARERVQARNLVERIFSKDKEAKVLIFVGYGHLYKSTLPNGMVMMGAHLRQITNLDMLHVDQTVFYAHPDRSAEHPLYETLLSKPHANAPFVLRTRDRGHVILGMAKDYVDMHVVFPRYAMRHGRPEWLETLAARRPHDIPLAMLPVTGRRLIQAYRISGGVDAIPSDNVLVEAGKPVPKLMLPKGEFRFAFQD